MTACLRGTISSTPATGPSGLPPCFHSASAASRRAPSPSGSNTNPALTAEGTHQDFYARTAHNDEMIVNVAFNYGGRADIVEAVRRLIADGVRPEDVTEEAITARLATSGLPEPDLLIRTGGDFRISNFLVWQVAYAECYFTDVQWPDFGAADVDHALLAYQRRQRRFGLVHPPAEGTLLRRDDAGT